MSISDAPPPDAPWPTAPPGAPGLKIGFPEARHRSSPPHRFSHRALITLLVAGLAVLSTVLIIVAILATPGPAPNCTIYKCQGPPVGHPGKNPANQAEVGPPVANGTLYTSSQGFSLRYSLIASGFPDVTMDSAGIAFRYDFSPTYGGTQEFVVRGASNDGPNAQTLVGQVISANFPNAQPVYYMPQPLVGYQPGFGEAFNLESESSDGSTATYRLLVLAAVQNGFQIIMVAYGSFIPVGTNSPMYNGHPSPADINVAYAVDPIIDSIRFP